MRKLYLLAALILLSCNETPFKKPFVTPLNTVDLLIKKYDSLITYAKNEPLKDEFNDEFKRMLLKHLDSISYFEWKGTYEFDMIYRDVIYYEVSMSKYKISDGYFKNSNPEKDKIIKSLTDGDSVKIYGKSKNLNLDKMPDLFITYSSKKPDIFIEIDSIVKINHN